ncbi:MAG TPA: dTDP-glucose 4,6-dehydratase [Gammaproteobacteria bacterium]|nr:dTDP-glucose 4,6-dehydratase [Gammaproteobacteria bacterium]
MAELLVTGGAGFIGANFVHYWARTHPEDRVVVLDALTYAGNPASLDSLKDSPRFRFVHGSIGDQTLVESLLRDEAIDTIVNFAAESHVDRSISAADVFLETNVLGTHSLLKAARRVWIEEGPGPNHRFHHISTDEVYGSLGPDEPAFTESTPCAPNSPYSASKAASDHLVRAYGHTYGLKVTTSRCSNNYGPFQFPEKLIPLVIVNILAGKPLPIYGDGRNVRDWLHVGDHCRGLELVLKLGTPGEVYNLGGKTECDNLTLVEKLCAIVDERFASDASLRKRFPDATPSRGEGSAKLIQFVKDRPGHDRRYAVDTAKSTRELGFSPRLSLTEGLHLTVDWYLGNETWWRGVMDSSYREWIDRHYR